MWYVDFFFIARKAYHGASSATLHSDSCDKADLDYKESKRTGQYDNRFRYRAKVCDVHGAHVRRWALGVFLVRQ
jgi:hypothetical protein